MNGSCNRCFVAIGLALAVVHSTQAQTRSPWRVDDFYLGEPRAEIKVPLSKDKFEDNRESFHSSSEFWERQEVVVAPDIGVVRCQGRKLYFKGKPFLKKGDSLGHAKEKLGNPDQITGLMGWCQEDPFVRWVYRRGSEAVILTVSNVQLHTPQERAVSLAIESVFHSSESE
jgi:hypothetical protein